jgi:chromatin segregation and condensation protein Rec8/ScpA/Scc1 (kleisin family)
VTDALAASEFEAAEEAAAAGQAMVVDIEGYEGPLHLLLALARAQKVDLLKISVLELAEQYLASCRRPAVGASRSRLTTS